MGQYSKIEWTHHTFNPWWGCVKVSPACKHCYAQTWAQRLGLDLWGGDDTPRRFFSDAHWREPLKWNREAEAISALADSAASGGVPSGAIMYHRRSSAPAGWVELRSGTIGGSGSGATVRANTDTANLFELIWTESDNAAAPIQDSSGAPSSRGVSAAADFSAGKRLPLDDMRAAFLRSLDNGRGIDAGRLLGSEQASENKSHTHSGTTADVTLNVATGTISVSPASVSGDPALTGASGTPHGHTFSTDASGSTESRPLNRAYLCCIKL